MFISLSSLFLPSRSGLLSLSSPQIGDGFSLLTALPVLSFDHENSQ